MRRLFIFFREQWIVSGFFLVTAAILIVGSSLRTEGKISKVETVEAHVVRFGGRYIYAENNHLIIVVKLKNGVVWQIDDPYQVSRNCSVGDHVKIRVIDRDSGPSSMQLVNNSCKPSRPNNS
jgi:hypothetical protein